MGASHLRLAQGFTLLEAITVIAVLGVLAAIAWPLTQQLLDHAVLVTATDLLTGEIRKAQREARAVGRMLELRIDPSADAYVVAPVGLPGRQGRLPSGVAFGSPDGTDPDGVTFRDNIARFSPRPGLQNSFGSITVRSRTGARRVTVSITGHVVTAVWSGEEWQ